MDGVREEYAGETFYKDDLDDDRLRVEKLFRGAKQAGVAVKTEACTAARLASVMLEGRLVIVLTDRRLLRPKVAKTTRETTAAAGLRAAPSMVSYKTRARSGAGRAAGASAAGVGEARGGASGLESRKAS